MGLEDLPASIRGNLGDGYPPPPRTSPIKPLDELLTEVERRLIETALNKLAATNRAPPNCWGSRDRGFIAGSRSSISPTMASQSMNPTPLVDLRQCRPGKPKRPRHIHARGPLGNTCCVVEPRP